MKISFVEIFQSLNGYIGPDLKNKIRHAEGAVASIESSEINEVLTSLQVTSESLSNAGAYKMALGQINTTIHALGILKCLPQVLEEGERIEYVSLGAGNTGREWDLETNLRVAEFKFINWKGGSESVRENSIFKDFVSLDLSDSPKKKCLYSLGVSHVLKFMNGQRAISSVVSGNARLAQNFKTRYADQFSTVREYYSERSAQIEIIDISDWVPELIQKIET